VDQANRRLAKTMRQRLTRGEFALWCIMRNRGLGALRFRRQAPIGPYIVDFFCTEAELAIEIDGGQHFRRGDLIKDAKRDAWLSAHGVHVLRFSNREVVDGIDLVCEAILSAAKAAR
jgi:very-short-patch-repair endonuclease